MLQSSRFIGLAFEQNRKSSHQTGLHWTSPSLVAGSQGRNVSALHAFYQSDGDEDVSACSHDGSFDEYLDLSGVPCGPRECKMATGRMIKRRRNSSANLSIGASSVTTSSSSGLSGCSNLQHNMSMNTNSTTSSGAASMGLPASPLSFSSTNVTVSGSSGLVSTSLAQQGGPSLSRPGSHQDLLTLQQLQQPISFSNALPNYGSQLHLEKLRQNFGQQVGQPCDTQNFGCNQQLISSDMAAIYGNEQVVRPGHQPFHVPSSPALKQEQANEQSLSQLQGSIAGAKMKQDDLLQHHLMQNIFQRPDSVLSAQLQRQESLQWQQSQHIQAQLNRLQQQRMLQQQQLLQSLPQHIQRSHLHQQQQQQLQHLLQQQIIGLTRQPGSESGMAYRRFMQFLQSQRLRPADNSITFWRKFVAEYFSPQAKMRWCVSSYGAAGRQSTGVFPQDLYHCDLCNCHPGRGFEATFEVLPRLFKLKYDNGELEELLFVDLPQEFKVNSGLTVMKYERAIQENVFEQLRVVRDGQLRIIFNPDLKILMWEFCARGHEELLPRRTVAHQVNQLAAIASKCQSNVIQNGGSGLSAEELQSTCNLFVASARQLAKNWDAPPINETGFTKRFVRCLQISEVVNSMKDLIDFSRQHNIGPIESLNLFPRKTGTSDGMQNQDLQPQDPGGVVTEQGSSKVHPVSLNIEKQRSLNANTIASLNSLLRQNSSSLQNFVNNDAAGPRAHSASGSFPNSLQASPSSSLTSLSGNPHQPSLDSLSNSVHQNDMNSLLQHSSLQHAQLNQQNSENIVHQLLQEMMSPRSNDSSCFQQGQRFTGANTPSGIGTMNTFPGSGSLGMNNGISGANIGNMGNAARSIPSGLIRNTSGNNLDIANCTRTLGVNAPIFGNIGAINDLGNRINLAALVQQQNLMQDGTSNHQHDLPHGLSSLGSGAEFGSFPMNWKS